MPMFQCLEVRQITAYKDNAIWKTKILGHRWFEFGKCPECYVKFKIDDMDCIYVSTLTTHMGTSKPLDSI